MLSGTNSDNFVLCCQGEKKEGGVFRGRGVFRKNTVTAFEADHPVSLDNNMKLGLETFFCVSERCIMHKQFFLQTNLTDRRQNGWKTS